MSEYENKKQVLEASRKTYSPDSANEFDDLLDGRNSSMMIDNNNIIMKTPQSLDDLLDVDDNNNENSEDNDENESNHNDDVDNDSAHLSNDNLHTTETSTQKKSIKKTGKIQ